MGLADILASKRLETERLQMDVPLAEVEARALAAPPCRQLNFGDTMSLIGEVKRRSPSQGDLKTHLDPVKQAASYQEGGASAISVLTDETYFGGSFRDLQAVRQAVTVPVLCKDFILSFYQLYEARAAGADLVLLIVKALDDLMLARLQNLSIQLGMTPLVEVHDQHDLARAIARDARLIGINNRDLTDFSVDLVTTEYLAPLIPDEAVAISESGISRREDVRRVAEAGARGVLVGETLIRSADPANTIRELLS